MRESSTITEKEETRATTKNRSRCCRSTRWLRLRTRTSVDGGRKKGTRRRYMKCIARDILLTLSRLSRMEEFYCQYALRFAGGSLLASSNMICRFIYLFPPLCSSCSSRLPCSSFASATSSSSFSFVFYAVFHVVFHVVVVLRVLPAIVFI
jgi:hypothetical protein